VPTLGNWELGIPAPDPKPLLASNLKKRAAHRRVLLAAADFTIVLPFVYFLALQKRTIVSFDNFGSQGRFLLSF
jgi:hypothetical protein